MLCMLLLFHLNSIFLQWLLVGFRINLVHPHAFAMCKKKLHPFTNQNHWNHTLSCIFDFCLSAIKKSP